MLAKNKHRKGETNNEKTNKKNSFYYPVPCYAEGHEKLDELIASFEAGDVPDEGILIRIISLVRVASQQEETNPVALRMREWIADHAVEEWSLAEMAETICISRFYMCHLFRKEFGLPILEYRNALRLTLAKQKLLNTNDQIGKIAVDCGFGTASYFGEVFQISEGVTPGQYRKLHQ